MGDINIHRVKIRAKKLGVLIADSRMAARRTVEDCAAYLGILPDVFKAYEKGGLSPSLPLLEALSLYLDVPLSHFWENTILSPSLLVKPGDKEKNRRELRDRIIATRLRKERKNADISLRQIGKAVSLPAELIKQYEMAEIPIPVPELELLAGTLHISLESFMDDIGQMREWRQIKDQQTKFFNLDPEARAFITDPGNKRFLNLAISFSQLPDDRLDEIIQLIPNPEDAQNL